MTKTIDLPAKIVAAILLMAAALAGCEAPPRPPQVALRIAVYRSQDYLPYYVMQERGYDRKYGLNFTESPVTGGAEGIDAMVAGDLDMSLTAIVPLLAAAERGLIPDKIVPVATNNFAEPGHPGGGLLIGSAVRDWKDLEGKKIGTNAFNSIMTAAVDIRLKQERVRGYSFLVIPASNRGLAVAGGNIAAASMTEPHLTQSLVRGDGKLLDWVIGGPPFERMEFSTIVFSADFRRRSPEGVKAFLRAHLAAVRWIDDHPEAARRLLGRWMNISPDVAKQVNLARWPLDARTDPALLDQTLQVLLRYGLIQPTVDTRSLHDQTLLVEVLKEAR